MQHLYVDESGSMTKEYSNHFPYFVICTVKVINGKKLKSVYKRFVSKYRDELKRLDDEKMALENATIGKMFSDNTFKELKGSCFDYNMKEIFVNTFCRSDLLEVYYIKVTNKDVKDRLYKNTARAFNFLYKIKLRYFLRKRILPNEEYNIQFDNRNQKNDSKNSLEDYLNTELHLYEELTEEIKVDYFDSQNNCFIQIADVFSNLFYSYLFQPHKYKNLIKNISDNNLVKGIYKFPYYKG